MKPEPISFLCPRCAKVGGKDATVHQADAPVLCDGCRMDAKEEAFFSRKMHCWCMAVSSEGRPCLIDRDEHAGRDHWFIGMP